MRHLAPTIPVLLLGCIFVYCIRQGGEELVPEATALPAVQVPETGGVIWVSHDWVEVVPQKPARSRRETFGLDSYGDLSKCTDPKCRACLIDAVYGREF